MFLYMYFFYYVNIVVGFYECYKVNFGSVDVVVKGGFILLVGVFRC